MVFFKLYQHIGLPFGKSWLSMNWAGSAQWLLRSVLIRSFAFARPFCRRVLIAFPFILQREFSSSLIYTKVERRFASGCRSDTAPDVIAGPEK